jgi:hypothetical protein
MLICAVAQHLDAHHMRPSLALELDRLALSRIKVRSLAGFDGNRYAGGPQTVHLVVVGYFGQRQGEFAPTAIIQEVTHGTGSFRYRN